MRNTKKKKLNLKKIRIASIDELNSVKGGNTNACPETETCGATCSVTCSGKTYPFVSVIIPCLETRVGC